MSKLMFDQLISITRDLLMDYMYSMDAVFSLKRRNSSKSTYSNWIQLKNSDISGAHCTLRIDYQYTQTQVKDSARDVRAL